MGIPSDDLVVIRDPEVAGGPCVITVSCPDKTGLGCDLCRVILSFGLSITKGDFSTDGKWCYIVFWVEQKNGIPNLRCRLQKRLAAVCPAVSTASVLYDCYYMSQELMEMEPPPQVYLLKLSCLDRTGLLHDVTQALFELEFDIRRVKVSTTPDGRVMDLFLITDTRELLHTKGRKEEAYEKLSAVLGDSLTKCDIELANKEVAACLQTSPSLPPGVTEEMLNLELPEESPVGSPSSSTILSVSMDNSLSPSHTLIQIICRDHKGLLYDIMRTLKDYSIQVSYGRFVATKKGNCEIDLFVMLMDDKKILDPSKQSALCSRLRMELYSPLRAMVLTRGPELELLVANPIELCGKGRPLVFYDITHALKKLHVRVFSAEIGRHTIGDREWEVYKILLWDDFESFASEKKIVDGVKKMLMGWK